MPEGDTIAYAANRMRPVLEGQVPDAIETPQRRHAMDRWPERLSGRAVTAVDTHGKHLFLRFEGDLVLHSHLGMSGVWGVYGPGRRWGRSRSRAWLVVRRGATEVVEFDGPVLELVTAGRVRFDQRLAALGPDVLADEFRASQFLARLRADDQTRPIGDALLDQRNVAGIGNIWKAEGCWEASIDPWRPVSSVSDRDAVAIIEAMRPRMSMSAREGPRSIRPRVYRRVGQPCPRCGERVRARGQGDANRTTYWCPGCQK
ncbi:MAG: Fpg/Nei family DNA glycosylase [Solirubrobacterales bacterium]|nr:Fpg/Nei family DNA glycosylase [Solirubrobacterales bacterium]MBV9799757.1 Fpg/Nei family DNA glycosylase [Solirubrobacterales bacterium]